MNCSTPGFPVLHYLQQFAQTHVHQVNDDIQPSPPCHLLLPSVFPSIRVFSKELVFHIRWPEYWSFSFNVSPSSEYSGLISFWIDWFDLLSGESHGQRSLAGCSPWGCKESDMTEQVTHTHTHTGWEDNKRSLLNFEAHNTILFSIGSMLYSRFLDLTYLA